jgi:hypothetical protein
MAKQNKRMCKRYIPLCNQERIQEQFCQCTPPPLQNQPSQNENKLIPGHFWLVPIGTIPSLLMQILALIQGTSCNLSQIHQIYKYENRFIIKILFKENANLSAV